jgi:hypothetical protein
MRTIGGIIIGYLIFAFSALVLFRVTHHNPHAPATPSFEITAIAYGIFFAFLAGYWGNMIAGRSDFVVPGSIAVIVAVGAIVSMAFKGISWSPLSGLILMTPAVLVGGFTYLKRRKR